MICISHPMSTLPNWTPSHAHAHAHIHTHTHTHTLIGDFNLNYSVEVQKCNRFDFKRNEEDFNI